MQTMLNELNPVGMRAEYLPSGRSMPIEDDMCLDGTCEGIVVETVTIPVEDMDLGRAEPETWFLVKWDFCCPMHYELTSGHIPADVLPDLDFIDQIAEMFSDYPDWDNRHEDEFAPEKGHTWEHSSDIGLIAPIGQI